MMNRNILTQKIQKWLKKTKPFTVTALLSVLTIYGKTINTDNMYFANPFISSASAGSTNDCTPDETRIATLKNSTSGFFKNIRFAEKNFDTSTLSFKTLDDKELTLSHFQGKVLLVNLWATWCKPCRVEMPELSHLKTTLGGDDFEVITVNIDKAPNEKVLKFLQSIKADNLKFYRDSSMKIFQMIRREGLALGLPVTLLIDEKGCLLGSFNGAAPWGDEDSQELIKAAIKTKAN